jgi:2,4-dienoyl-CoA reductase-like NADH-dependent reductase (Old Yellow Enzyme family)
MSRLFSPLTLRDTTFPNRAWVSPMCQYSSVEGRPSDWHLVHLGALARGGAGLVMSEATAVTPEGRISPADAGIWTDEQAADYRRITEFIRSQGSVPGIQLAHAGRKASTQRPWDGRGYVAPADGGWQTVAPSPIAFGEWPAPRELSREDIAVLVEQFAQAAQRSLDSGFQVAEIHAAHGYLLHEFLSPLSNVRTDEYGGDLAGRSRFLVEVVDAVRAVWPAEQPLFVRFSATDWAEGGWSVEETAQVAKQLGGHGVDLVDISSGGLVPDAVIPTGPGYQVPFAREVRAASSVPVGAVGMITEPVQAEQILTEGSADAVFLARAVLRNPSWPQAAAAELGAEVRWPVQYARARLRR